MSNPTERRDRGITLIEMMVVLVILGMVATLVGQNVFRNVDKARQTQAKTQISQFESTLDVFRLDVGRYPTTQEGLQALRVQPAGVENWDGPYLREDVPADPWNRAYIYRAPGQNREFDLISLGSDGAEGGEGYAADVIN